MPIQYPDFRADPNAVPQLKGLPTFIDSLQKGYQMAQLPAQMRMQRAMQQQQLQKGAMENYYYPLTQEQNLAQSRAVTQGQLLQNQYYPSEELLKQQLTRSQIGETNANTGLTNEQAKWYAPLTQSEIDKNRADASKTDNGIQIGTDENGNPIIQIGGTSSGGGGAFGGKLGTDARGNVVSMPTRTVQTSLQNRKVGEDVAGPFIDQIIKTMPQFQTPLGRAQLGAASLANQFGVGSVAQLMGINTDLPSQYAQGQTSITSGAEGLMKASALNNNSENFQMVRSQLQPLAGENPEGYRNRVIAFWNTIKKNTDESQGHLASGFNTGVNVNGPQSGSVNLNSYANVPLQDLLAEKARRKQGGTQ